MSEKERIELLEEVMDVDPGTLEKDSVLADFEEWDSLTALTLISEMDARFGKKLSGEEVKGFKTVADVIAVME